MTELTGIIDAVSRAMRDAAERAVVPRFRTLKAHAITEKSPGDWVTDADHECEDLLTAALHAIEPGVAVVGEEAVAADPSLLTVAHGHARAWLVDPVDGTKAFIDGSPDFATMVALVEDGVTTASWIWQPIHRQMFAAVRGQGATAMAIPSTHHATQEHATTGKVCCARTPCRRPYAPPRTPAWKRLACTIRTSLPLASPIQWSPQESSPMPSTGGHSPGTTPRARS